VTLLYQAKYESNLLLLVSASSAYLPMNIHDGEL